jgi:hypothetical protein
MASFQTFFRTVIMLATLGIVAKVWYLYGPSVDEMKAIGTRVAEVSSQAWTEYWQKPADGALADDPRVPTVGAVPAPFDPQGTLIEPMPHSPNYAADPRGTGAVQLAGGMPAEIVPVSPAGPSTAWPPQPTRLPPNDQAPMAPTAPADARLSTLLERLAQLGVRDQELSSWGSRGELMRFSCNMPWANSPAYSRHFEAVASTPVAAVEQVAAEIAAWQNGQR